MFQRKQSPSLALAPGPGATADSKDSMSSPQHQAKDIKTLQVRISPHGGLYLILVQYRYEMKFWQNNHYYYYFKFLVEEKRVGKQVNLADARRILISSMKLSLCSGADGGRLCHPHPHQNLTPC